MNRPCSTTPGSCFSERSSDSSSASPGPLSALRHDDEPARRCHHDLLAEQRPAAPFDQPQRRVHLVRAVQRHVELQRAVELHHLDALATGHLVGSGGGGNDAQAPLEELVSCPQQLHHLPHSPPGSQPDRHPGRDQLHGRRRGRGARGLVGIAHPTSEARSSIESTAASARDTGQPFFAASATCWNSSSDTPGTLARVSSSIRVIPKPSPTLSMCTVAVVSMLSAECPACPSSKDRAIEKQPACAAAISSSGFVPSPSWKRDWNEYGPSYAPLAIRMIPLPSCSDPSQRASAVLFGIAITSSRVPAGQYPRCRRQVAPAGDSASRRSRQAA